MRSPALRFFFGIDPFEACISTDAGKLALSRMLLADGLVELKQPATSREHCGIGGDLLSDSI